MKKKYFMMITVAALMLASCGGAKETEATEETVAEIEAAQLAGRSAARRIVNQTFRDSMALHSAILEANSERSKYELEKKPKCEAAYDSAFISTIRVTRPDLADQLAK